MLLILLEALAAVLCLAGPLFIQAVWRTLPELVPIHFGLDRRPDRWGARAWIWLLPAVGVVEYVAFTLAWLGEMPQADRLLMALLKVEALAMFLFIEREQVRVACGQAERLGPQIWWLTGALVLTALLAPLVLSGGVR